MGGGRFGGDDGAGDAGVAAAALRHRDAAAAAAGAVRDAQGCALGKTSKSRSSRRPTAGITVGAVDAKDRPFGALIHMDHLEMERGPEAAMSAKYCLNITDERTGFFSPHPCSKRDKETVLDFVHKFEGPDLAVRRWWTDSAPELAAAASVVRPQRPSAHHRSPPHRPQASGRAECMSRLSVEGDRSLLQQAGMSERWWPLAIRHRAACYNAYRVDEAGMAPWFRRFNMHAQYNAYPFGSLVVFRPPKGSSAPKEEAEQRTTRKWKSRLVPAVLVGNGLARDIARGIIIWSPPWPASCQMAGPPEFLLERSQMMSFRLMFLFP